VNIGLLLALAAASHPSEPAPVPRPPGAVPAREIVLPDPPAFDPPDPKWLAQDFGAPRTDRRAKRDRSGRVGRRDYARGKW
jgi:hypothetical protein